MIIKQVFLLFLSAFSVSVIAATETAISKGATADGAKVYLENCSICHGDAGDGNTRAKGSLRPPPRNFTTVNSALELTRERMLDSVINGRPGTGMMSHKDRLSSQEIEAVVDYIRGNFMNFPKDKNSKQVVVMAGGEKIYSKHCSVCHGDKGTTAIWAKSGLNPQPRDFTTVKARQELTNERMIDSVSNGRPGTAMMPHKEKLSKQEIEQVVNYIRTAFMSGPVAVEPSQPSTTSSAHPGMPAMAGSQQQQPMSGRPQIPGFSVPSGGGAVTSQHPAMNPQSSTMQRDPHQRQNPHGAGVPGVTIPQAPIAPVVTADMSAAMPGGLKGNIKKGREFYMNNCFTCHGVTGEGNGPRAHFNTPRPRNFTSDASRRMLNRVRLFNSITNGKVGTVMPAWGKVLDDQQIANITEFVFNTFIVVKNADSQSKQKASLEKKKVN